MAGSALEGVQSPALQPGLTRRPADCHTCRRESDADNRPGADPRHHGQGPRVRPSAVRLRPHARRREVRRPHWQAGQGLVSGAPPPLFLSPSLPLPLPLFFSYIYMHGNHMHSYNITQEVLRSSCNCLRGVSKFTVSRLGTRLHDGLQTVCEKAMWDLLPRWCAVVCTPPLCETICMPLGLNDVCAPHAGLQAVFPEIAGTAVTSCAWLHVSPTALLDRLSIQAMPCFVLSCQPHRRQR